MKKNGEKTEIVNIRKETDSKVVIETKSGTNFLKSTVYIFPKDIFISGAEDTLVVKK